MWQSALPSAVSFHMYRTLCIIALLFLSSTALLGHTYSSHTLSAIRQPDHHVTCVQPSRLTQTFLLALFPSLCIFTGLWPSTAALLAGSCDPSISDQYKSCCHPARWNIQVLYAYISEHHPDTSSHVSPDAGLITNPHFRVIIDKSQFMNFF